MHNLIAIIEFQYINKMVKDITITSLQKEIKTLEKRISKLEIQVKDVNKPKKIKDPNAPKKPITGFIFFNKHKIDEYKKKNPNQKIKVTEIGKQSGVEWKNLKNDEKDKYLKMAIKDKKRYEKEINLYKK
jgi:hypothetical protein